MANFNTDVNITPDRGLRSSQKPRTFVANYGDGYQQRVAAGINNIPEEWTLTWKNRASAEANKIIKFLEDLNGTSSFDWYPPGYDIGSTTTSAATNKLIDTSQYFTKRYLNATVTDSASNTAVINAIDSATQLTLSADIMASGETYTIYPYLKFICSSWDITEPVQGFRTVSAKFTRVFEP